MGYVPGLDGIRALAVLGVLVFHGSAAWLPGGFLGVDVFFVLSGFLISTILLEQLETRGGVNFGDFYLRRARRLLPALFASVAFSAVLIVLFAQDAAAGFRRTVLPALLYVANWSFIHEDLSYFEAIGRPSLLQHLWSLAIEEQFYLIWPVVLFFLYRRWGRRGVGRTALGLALVSTLLMAVLSLLWDMPGQADASRLYFGTDTHAMGLLVGASLAAFFRPGAMPRDLGRSRRLALTGIGVLAVAVVVFSYANATEQGLWLYRGGFLLFALASAVMIAVVAHPAALLGTAFSWSPLRYIGTRSYGLYLYHWPIFVVLRPEIDVPLGTFATFVLRLALTFAAAELSYRFLETPIRRGTAWPAAKAWFTGGPSTARRLVVVAVPTVAVSAAVATVIVTAPTPSAADFLGGVTEVNAEPLVGAPEPAVASPTPSPVATPSVAPTPAVPTPTAPPAPPPPAISATTPVTMVGDSISVGAAGAVATALPNATVDAAVSRQSGSVFERIGARQTLGVLDPVVVIQTGTNGQVDAAQLTAMLESLADRQRVVLVTSHGPNWWQAEANETMTTVGAKFANVRIADFAAAANGHGEFFVDDGIHLSSAGLDVFAALIAQTVQSA